MGIMCEKVLTEHSRKWAGIPYLHNLSTLISFFWGGGVTGYIGYMYITRAVVLCMVRNIVTR